MVPAPPVLPPAGIIAPRGSEEVQHVSKSLGPVPPGAQKEGWTVQ